MPRVRAAHFIAAARVVDGQKLASRKKPLWEEVRSFKANYGVSPSTAGKTYRKLRRTYGEEPKLVHVLWALSFLKTYGTEDVLSKKFKTSHKTYRKHKWRLVKQISGLYSSVVSTSTSKYNTNSTLFTYLNHSSLSLYLCLYVWICTCY